MGQTQFARRGGPFQIALRTEDPWKPATVTGTGAAGLLRTRQPLLAQCADLGHAENRPVRIRLAGIVPPGPARRRLVRRK
jgi:hypothetical protein